MECKLINIFLTIFIENYLSKFFLRGPFITALGRTWCPSNFVCNMDSCRKSLQDVGFVEEKGEEETKIYPSSSLYHQENCIVRTVMEHTWPLSAASAAVRLLG